MHETTQTDVSLEFRPELELRICLQLSYKQMATITVGVKRSYWPLGETKIWAVTTRPNTEVTM